MSTIPAGFVPKRHRYTIKEAAEFLGICEKSVRRAIKRGLLRASKAFSKIFIPGEDVETFFARTC